MPVWQTLLLAALFFAFAGGRFVPSQAIISMAVPRERREALAGARPEHRRMPQAFQQRRAGEADPAGAEDGHP